MPDHYLCDPPGWGSAIPICSSGDSVILPLYLGQKCRFSAKKKRLFLFRPKNGPKMAQKWSKLPKIGQNRRNNSRGSPRKSQRIPKISGKWPKTLPQCNMKMHPNSKNGQKLAKTGKNYKKNRFSLQQLPKKGHFLKEMHHFFFRATPLRPPGGSAIPISRFCDSVILPLYLSLATTG